MHSVHKKALPSGATPSADLDTHTSTLQTSHPLPDRTMSVQRQRSLARSLQRFTTRPVSVQRAVAAPALTAAALYSSEVVRLQRERQTVQRRAEHLGAQSPAAFAEHALQRHAEVQPAPTVLHPRSTSDWVTVMRQQAEQVEGRRLDPKALRQFTALQRQVAAHLTEAYRQDRQPGSARTAEYATHLAALQRHPVSEPVARAVLTQVPAGERVSLQRAVDGLREQEALQRQQDEQALQAHALQRQLAELDEQAAMPVMERIQQRRGGGNPLPASVQRHLEQGLNHDLSGVRIHDDAEADKLAKGVNATAFTTGSDIYFQSGKFDPNTQSGLELLAHEVTHTVQQAQGKVGNGIDPDAGLESEARNTGRRLSVLPIRRAAAPRTEGTAPLLQPVRGMQRQASITLQRKAASAAAITPAALMEAIRMPQVKSAVIKAALAQNLPPSFWNEVIALGSAKYKRDWARASLSILPDPLKAQLTLAMLGGEQELTYAAFINQLAYLVYANDPGLKDAKQIPGNAAQGAQKILQAAGYTAHPTIHGYWGFQMRIFTPIKGHPKPIGKKTIVAFRGTEGVNPNPMSYDRASPSPEFAKKNESGLDTLTDLAKYDTGYSQYEVNDKQIIGPALKAYGTDLVATGHSLGGALAQIAVVKNPSRFSEVYTFQGANIKAADVAKLDAMKALKARHYRVTGDQVPTSGEKGITGQVFDFDRKAGVGGVNLAATYRRLWKDNGEKTESLDAIDGHNAPILLEVLEDLQGQGLAKNTLAQTLVKSGSQDPNELAKFGTAMPLLRPYTSKVDTTPGKEAQKQAVMGTAFRPQFRTTYENNVVYNILLEQVMPLLQAITVQSVKNPGNLVERLQEISRRVATLPVAHTAQSLKMLDIIHPVQKLREQEAALKATMAQVEQQAATARGFAMSPSSPTSLTYQRTRLTDFQNTWGKLLNLTIPGEIVSENRQRLRRLSVLLDLWYSVHPTGDDLYTRARPVALRLSA